MRRPAAGPLTATAMTLVVALGGCGGAATEIGDLPADAVFLTAVDASTDISTVRVRYESTSRRDGEVLNTSTGEAVFAPGAVSITFTMAGLGRDADATDEVSYELRFVDGTMYMRIPEMPPGVGGDVPDAEWIVYDDGDTDDIAAQMEQLDFGATLQALRDSAEVTEEGRETIAGVATTRYVGTTTLRSLLLAQGMSEEQLEEELAAQQELGAGDGPDLDDPMPLTVWIGDDGLVRRYDYTTADGGFETTQSMTVLEYGLEVDITAPPAEAVTSAEDFESSYQSSSQSGFSSEDYEEYGEFESESSQGTITFESEGSATAEAVPAPSAAPSPAPSATGDSDG